LASSQKIVKTLSLFVIEGLGSLTALVDGMITDLAARPFQASWWSTVKAK